MLSRLRATTRPVAASSTAQHVVRGSAAVRRSPAAGQRKLAANAAFNLSDVPQETLYAGGAALAAVLGLIGYAVSNNQNNTSTVEMAAESATEASAAPAPLPRENAVLVFGASGKLGRKIVEKLVRSGRTVVAAVRSTDKASEVFESCGLKEGNSSSSGGILITAGGVDVTNPETLTAELFQGVTQVVSALGPVAGRLPDGSFGYIGNMSPERVEAQGISNIIAAIQKHAPQIAAATPISSSSILPMITADDLAIWERLDDVIMGGSSSSGLAAAEDGSGAVWSGDLIVEGGGFCGARTRTLNLNLSAYDGLQLRVKGDGQIFKINVKTADQEDTPESTYQATFDTSPEGDWTTVRLPWHNFLPVKKAQTDPFGKPLDPSSISKLGLVLSRFEFNKMPNPSYKPGPFQLQIAGGISAYKAPRPAIVAISSAGVERNAIIGDDTAARKRDIPIVQLNPGGVLNYKYESECTIRASGLPYTVIRCTGLDDKAIEGPALLEADQGDSISGKVSRDEAAQTVLAALSRPDAAYKTFELRRCEAADAQGKTMDDRIFNRLFLKLAQDRNRWRVGLPPFPKAVPPPAPPTEERTKEILADPRVQAVRERNAKPAAETSDNGQQQQDGGTEEAAASDVKEKEKELVSTNA
eukprot:GHUV01001185.1.p1 GENE.GHUV01001185.1~~GHUV01001185.1.p1  ORF type:complete len:643 (+),score=165.16 GHUV01001185.1:143-2071(+)